MARPAPTKAEEKKTAATRAAAKSSECWNSMSNLARLIGEDQCAVSDSHNGILPDRCDSVMTHSREEKGLIFALLEKPVMLTAALKWT